MKANMGNLDKVLRISSALVIMLLNFTGYLSGTIAIVLLLIAAIFILTSFISFCPLYYPFGLSSKPKNNNNNS